MPINYLIRAFAALLALFGALNLLVLGLSDHLQSVVPMILRPASTFGQALALFGVGASVYMLGEIAGRVGRGGGH